MKLSHLRYLYSGGILWSLTHSKRSTWRYLACSKETFSGHVLAEADESETTLHVDIGEFIIVPVIYNLLM